ncbi:twin-arginine translocase subunit TatC [Reichenbachiella sp. MALMAid0571]|uniref:twin-arginine translocase subunit TatC n=1 Tax=Reichenbachiella sp. MALMAid0571 TaxID=3143939 RepID=UPI0032E01958
MSNLPEVQEQPQEQAEMSFLDHLEELRWHIIRAVLAIGIFTIAAFLFIQRIYEQVILSPAKTDFWTYKMMCKLADMLGTQGLCIDSLPFIIQNRTMTGQFTMAITTSLVVGLICAFPYAFWEVWRFISPGMHLNERSVARGAVFYVSLLFGIGITFGYFILAPLSINFLSNFTVSPTILNEFDLVSYVSTITTLVLACGILFQLPMVVYFLTKTGLVTPDMLKTYRRHSIVVIFFLGAMLTPPDPFSQVLIALPLIGLYQFSMLISKRTYKKMKAEE